jgi:tetratricopeptide (TPR) repeat protein
MMKRTEVCTNAAFYIAQTEGTSFEEARAIVIGMYSEKELSSTVFEQVRAHLEICRDCRQVLQDLQQIDEFLKERQSIPFAICPSTEKLDTYHSQPESLEPDDRRKMAKHLQECPLCKEEVLWLDRIKPYAETPISRTVTWLKYAPLAAATAFLALSLMLVWNNSRGMIPEKQLQALAVIKEPAQVNFEALQQTAPALVHADQQIYEQGVTLFKEQRFSEAVPVLEKLLQKNPQHSATQMLLGYSYYKLNKPQEAFALCDRAEKAIPHSLERCLLLVNVALKTGHFGRAITEVTSLYHVAPDHPEVNRLYHQIQKITRGRLVRL